MMPPSHLKEVRRILRICLKRIVKTFLVLAEDIESRKYECLTYDLTIPFWEDANGASLCEDLKNSF